MPMKRYIPPDFKLGGKQVKEIPADGQAPATSWVHNIIGAFTYPFRILGASMILNERARNLVRHYWILATNPNQPSTNEASGTNLFTTQASRKYFSGSSVIRRPIANIEVRDIPVYIILSTYNGNAYAYDYNCSIKIQEL